MSPQNHALPVLIVGAGPTGLTLASELLRHGVQCRIVDKLEAPGDKSKALAIHARTLEILENMNVVDKMLAAGNQAGGFSIYNGQHRVMQISTAELDSPYPCILMIPQPSTERVLTEHLESLGGKVERGVELLNFTQDQNGLTVKLKHLDVQEEVVVSQWLVGCDGAHSVVRKTLQLPFEGSAYEERFALGDFHVESSLPDDEISTFFHEDGALVFFPMGNKRFRIMANMEESKIVGDEPTLDFLQSVADSRGNGNIKFSDPHWFAWFRIHRRSTPEYRVGRAFVAGDAAHIHSPVGGQGMNTGMQDVVNLAWKLALVVKGHADESLLDTYQGERHPVGQELLKGTDIATKVAVMRNPLAKQIRNHMIAFLSQQEVIVQRLRKVGTMMAVNYRTSPIVGEHRELVDMQLAPGKDSEGPTLPGWLEFARAPLPGDRAPDVVMFDQNNHLVRLFEAIRGTSHSLLLFDGKPTEEGYRNMEKIASRINEQFGDLITTHLIIAADKIPASLKFTGKVYLDPDLTVHSTYGASSESLYLIRPDGYIGFRSQPARLAPLLSHLSKLLKMAPVHAG